MLVTCPECNAKISEDADPCPKCGLRGAGKVSREYCEHKLSLIKKKIGEKRKALLSSCSCVCDDWTKITKSEVVLSSARIIPHLYRHVGYQVVTTIKCPKCGKEEEGFFWISEIKS